MRTDRQFRTIVFLGWVFLGVFIFFCCLADESPWELETVTHNLKVLLGAYALALLSVLGLVYAHGMYVDDRKKKGLHRWNNEAMDELEERVRKLEEEKP